jgi:adenine phosphoribosyltransferase
MVKMDNLKAAIREIPDWPKKGILFYDITTLLKDRLAFQQAIQALALPYQKENVDVVIGIEARGFIFAASVAYAMKAGFVPVRKPKKLPAPTYQAQYSLEYGVDSIEIHQDAVKPGQRVLIVDDLIATGGTAKAAAELVERMGGVLVGFAFLVELEFLHGRDQLTKYNITSVLKY